MGLQPSDGTANWVASTRVRVKVVGAGIAGLATAHLLARLGHDVEILDSAASAPEEGTALALQPNGLAVLEALGVAGELDAASSRMRQLRVFDGLGRAITTTVVPDFGPGLDHVLVAPRADVVRVLAAAGPVSVRWGADVGHAGPGLLDVQEGHDRSTVTADLIVGADGASSTVRRCFDLGVRRRGGRRYLRMMLERPLAHARAGEYWTRSGLAGMLPCGPARTYAYATATQEIVDAHASGADVAEAIGRAHPILAALLPRSLPSDRVLVNDVSTVDCRSFVGPGVVLVGDAAHAMAPNLGQGANSGLLDAAILTLELAQGDDLGSALERYDAQRQAVRRVQRDAERLARAAHSRGPREARNALARALGRLPVAGVLRRAQQCEPDELRARLSAALG